MEGDSTVKGNQSQFLLAFLQSTVDEITKNVSVTDWQRAYGGISSVNERMIQKLHTAFNSQLSKAIEKQVAASIEDLDVETTLGLRDKLIKEQEQYRGMLAWRPSGCVEDDIIAHNCAALEDLKIKLQKDLEVEEQDVKDLMEAVQRARSDISDKEKLLGDIQDSLSSTEEKLMKIIEARENEIGTLPQD